MNGWSPEFDIAAHAASVDFVLFGRSADSSQCEKRAEVEKCSDCFATIAIFQGD
jgi:hypothetical protein